MSDEEEVHQKLQENQRKKKIRDIDIEETGINCQQTGETAPTNEEINEEEKESKRSRNTKRKNLYMNTETNNTDDIHLSSENKIYRKISKTQDPKYSSHQSFRRTKGISESRKNHEKIREMAMKSIHILDKNINNPRHLGFSEFFSSNVFRNSSYCWIFGKDKRIKERSYKKLNDNIYNIPDLKSMRYTTQGFGLRRDLRPKCCKDTPFPDKYHIKSCFDMNILKKKGTKIGKKISYNKRSDKYKPGPGAYNSINNSIFGHIPVALKSRQGFFYDDDLKKKKATVSMQKYKPLYTLVEQSRFHGVSFGIGDRPKLYIQNRFPGPGAYRVPGNFDRGYRGKLPLN